MISAGLGPMHGRGRARRHRLGSLPADAGKPVRSWLLMRHLLKVRRLCEVPGHDATEGVQDSLSAFGGECRPEAAKDRWASCRDRAGGGQWLFGVDA